MDDVDASPAAGFDDVLSDQLLPLVLAHLPLEDLCRVQRVCRRLRRSVLEAQVVWRALYAATWPEQPADVQHQHRQQHQQHQHQQQQQQQQQHPQRQPEALADPATAPAAQRLSTQGSATEHSNGDTMHAAIPWPAAGSGGSSSSKRQRTSGPAAAATAAAGESSAAVLPSGGGRENWRDRFKARFVEDARRERLRRRARRLKADSALQVLRLELHQLEEALQRELCSLPGLQAELAAVQQARQQASAAALAQVYWQPVAVQLAHGVVTDQAPQDAEAREHDLQQRLAVARLEARKLRAALEAKRRRAAEAQRRLQALLP